MDKIGEEIWKENQFKDRTKLMLLRTIIELMQTTMLDDITVKQIVEEAGTTRQTFYRYYKDKYDLVNWYFDKIIKKTIRQIGETSTLEEGLVRKLEIMVSQKAFFVSALSSSDYNNLMDYDYKCICEYYKEIARNKNTLNKETEFLIEFYCHGSMDMLVQWVKKGMKESPEEMARMLIEALPSKLEEYLLLL